MRRIAVTVCDMINTYDHHDADPMSPSERPDVVAGGGSIPSRAAALTGDRAACC